MPESQDEIEILRKFNHRYIVKYLTSFTTLTSFTNMRGSLCIVMEYCDFGSLTKSVEVRKD